MTAINHNFSWAYALTPRSVTTHLILHHAAASKATAEGIHAYHLSKGWAGIAYHYFIEKTGEIHIGRPEGMQGGHTAGWNYCSIGICFEGDYTGETMPQAQLKAGRELISDIVSRYPAIVVGRHSDYGQTQCPGAKFPFDSMTNAGEPASSAEQTNAPSDWAKQACDWAVSKGFFKGDDKGCFNWHDGVTREMLALILFRASAQTS